MVDLGRWLDGTYAISEERDGATPSQQANHTDGQNQDQESAG